MSTTKYLGSSGLDYFWQQIKTLVNSSNTDTTYGISINNNVITLTDSNGQTSSVTLPVYNGGVT